MHLEQRIPNQLISEIRNGNCVAFVGAGFSAPAVPTWEELLRRLGSEAQLSNHVKNAVKELLGKPGEFGLFDREAAAQLIEEDLGDQFLSELDSAMITKDESGNKRVEARTRLLDSIPFQSIVTTNFDRHLSGTSFSDTDVRSLLRPSRTGWAEGTNWSSGQHNRPVVKIHGDITSHGQNDANDDPLVFSRVGYRRLLFEVPNYQAVLRSLLATRTILFIGFSFSDAYINLLRSETLSMFATKESSAPAAYAIVNDLSGAESDYLLQQEGIKTITYESNAPSDHWGFDHLLEELVDRASVDQVAAYLLSEKNILWFDPKPKNNKKAIKILGPRIKMGRGKLKIESDLSRAKQALESNEYDLLITHWGHQKPSDQNSLLLSNAQMLLRHLRHEGIETPTIVFASRKHSNANRLKALSLGAFEYLFDFQSLFLSIERLFGEIDDWMDDHEDA